MASDATKSHIFSTIILNKNTVKYYTKNAIKNAKKAVFA